jgi:hypothetical protein
LEIVGKKLVRPPQNGVGQVGEDRIKEEFRRSLRDSVKSYETQIINRSSKVIRNKIASVKKVRTAADRLRVALVEASNQGITIGSIESIYRKMDFVEAMLRIHLEPSSKREKKKRKSEEGHPVHSTGSSASIYRKIIRIISVECRP